MRKDLPRTVLPSHYDLFVNVLEDSFNGSVKMHLHAETAVSSFQFNSKGLELSGMRVERGRGGRGLGRGERGSERGESGESAESAESDSQSAHSQSVAHSTSSHSTSFPISVVSHTADDDFVTLTLSAPIQGHFTLLVNFKGSYSLSMEGLYKSEYNGDLLFSTHFEPSHARAAFPCFDQPDMKATFSVSIQAPGGFMALSNGGLVGVEELSVKGEGETETVVSAAAPSAASSATSPAPAAASHPTPTASPSLRSATTPASTTLFTFEKTPVMSTYILAYVVGKLEYIEDSSYVPIRVYAHKSEKQWGEFALKVAVRCLRFYAEYFKEEYPMSKLDMVAIPSFAMGAMENWGLVTYRKTSLLFDPSSMSIHAKKNIALTVSHELAHMWFGNLVTMKWWDDLWLNEGFATWAATLAVVGSVQDIFPWDGWTSFINDDVESGMSMDSKRSTHSVGSAVEDPIEVDQKFDAISYSKGSSVIKMLENWLGAETFRKGLVRYIKKHRYGNASTGDLWDALTAEAGDVNVSAVIGPWIQRDGFPYVKIKDDGGELQLRQERFTVGYRTEGEAPWPVPVRILWIGGEDVVHGVQDAVQRGTQRDTQDAERRGNAPASPSSLHREKYLMDQPTLSIQKKAPAFKLNDEVSGFYRVQYSRQMLERIVSYGGLSTANRMNLFSDAFALAKALYTPLEDALLLAEYLDAGEPETNYEVILALVSDLSFFRSVFYDNPTFFSSLISRVILKRFKLLDLTSSSEDLNTASLASLVAAKAVQLRLPEAMTAFQAAEPSQVHAEYLRPYLIANVDRDFQGTFKLYKESKRPGEKQAALIALGNTEEEKNVEFLFKNISKIEPQDSLYIFMALSTNLKFRNKAALLFIRDFKEIRKHVANSGLVRHSLEFLLSAVYQEEVKGKVIDFLNTLREDREMKSAIEKCMDSLVVGEKIRERYSGVSFEM